MPIIESVQSAITCRSRKTGLGQSVAGLAYIRLSANLRISVRTLQSAVDALRELSEANDAALQRIEVINSNGEVIIGGTQNGLVWLALKLAELALENTPFGHLHLDESGAADRADIPVVFRVSPERTD
jgi:hypothetical protein